MVSGLQPPYAVPGPIYPGNSSFNGSMQGTFAQRPTAGNYGLLFFATDTGKVYFDNGTTWTDWTPLSAGSSKPTGSIAETMARTTPVGNLAVLTSTTMSMVAINLSAGAVVSTVSFISATTALGTGVNQWFALYSGARAKLAVTADDTSTAWGANTLKTLTLSAPYTVLTTGQYYLGICVVATTVPTLRGQAVPVETVTIPPILQGTSDTGLGAPSTAPTTAAVITPVAGVPYAYVS